MSIQYTADQLQRKFRGATGSPGFSRLAEVLRSEGRLDEAIQTCLEGLRARPNTLSGHVVLGKAYLDAGRVEESRDQFEAALRLDPRCLSAMHHLARIMTKMQWPDAALGYYRSILEVEPWDAEIRALLSGTTQEPMAAMTTGGPAVPASDFYAEPAGEDTYQKPEGFAGDVMEVNLNDMAADFLPGQDDVASMGMAEESLEDALAASQEPMAHQPRFEAPAQPEIIAGPRPMDELQEGPVPITGMDGDAPPISGQDVEDRLDSLFGVEDAPSATLRDATATWTPAPAESPAPEIPPAPDFSLSDPSAAATVFGEMRASETGEMRLPVESENAPAGAIEAEPDLKMTDSLQPTEIPGVQDFSAVDFEPPLEQRAPAGSGAFADQGASGPEDRVHGEDIERRLDELFNLTEDDDRPPVESSVLPVAPGPRMDEAVRLGEVVSFGGEVAFEEPIGAVASATEPAAAIATPVEDTVTGQDVADKLDILFGAEIEAPSDTRSDASGLSLAASSEPVAASKEPTPWPKDDLESEQPNPSGDMMSTESMLPPGWAGKAGDGPGITGADVEAQLDRLFQIDTDGETLPGGALAAAGNEEDTFASPGTDTLAVRPAVPAPGDGSDLTVMMPAMRETPATPKDAGSIKDSVAEWLARRTEDADRRSTADRNPIAGQTGAGRIDESDEAPGLDFGAGDTLILPAEETESMRDFEVTPEPPAAAREVSLSAFQDDDSFGTLAPEDSALLSETTAIEMVDGEDVAGRLDALFADGDAAGGPAYGNSRSGSPSDGEMPLFPAESGESPDLAGIDALEPVSGEDVSSRLQQLFEGGDAPVSVPEAASQSESGVATGSDTGAVGSETDEDMVPLSGTAKPAAAIDSVAAPVPELAPMSDEEDAYPDEDESAAGSGAGANVATVTLAEIYFQQGLREQALQIYRQLLEREPENDSARKRIEEIEATKPDGGEPGPGSDPRRPRPGLKVPKRKK